MILLCQLMSVSYNDNDNSNNDDDNNNNNNNNNNMLRCFIQSLSFYILFLNNSIPDLCEIRNLTLHCSLFNCVFNSECYTSSRSN